MKDYRKKLQELEEELKALEEYVSKAETEKSDTEKYCGLIKEKCINTLSGNDKELKRLEEFKEKRSEKEETLKKSKKILLLSRILLILSILSIIPGFICVFLAAVQIGMGVILACAVLAVIGLETTYNYLAKNREVSKFMDLFKLNPEEIDGKIEELKLAKSETEKSLGNIEGILKEKAEVLEEAKIKVENQRKRIESFKKEIEKVIEEFVPDKFPENLKEVFDRYIDRAYRLTLGQNE